MKKLILCLTILFMMSTISRGATDPSDYSVYHNIKSKVMSYGNITKNWTVKYVYVAKTKTVEGFHTTKNWVIKTKEGIVYYIGSEKFEVFYDMLYLTADGFTLGFVFDDERCKDIIKRHPISGRIVRIGSRIIIIIIISKGVTEITHYIIRSFANGGVYTSSLNGIVNYVGRTNNFARRTLEWAKEGRIITLVYKTPFLCEQRVVEQTLINRYGIINLANKINSISP